MLTKAQTLLAIQKSLIKYNEIVATQIDSKIAAHNTVATTTAPGHMSAAMVTKLNGIAEGAEVNQNAISTVQIGKETATAGGKQSTITFKSENGVNVKFDASQAILISGVNATTSAKGVVQLTDGVASTSTSTAATANAAKTAYDKANAAQEDLNNFKTTVSSTYMPIAGGAFTGEVTLKAAPTKDLGAATKGYVDSAVSGLSIGNYMPKSGGTFTGAITLAGAPTAELHAATKKYVDDSASTAVANIIDSAPETLDTLNELAAALNDDPNFATTMTNALANKVDKVSGKGLSTNDYTTAEKTKLAGIAEGAEVNVQADWNVTDSTKDAFIKNKPAIPTIDSTFSASSTNAAQSKVIATWVNGQISTEIGKLNEADVTDAEITTMIAAVQAEVIK